MNYQPLFLSYIFVFYCYSKNIISCSTHSTKSDKYQLEKSKENSKKTQFSDSLISKKSGKSNDQQSSGVLSEISQNKPRKSNDITHTSEKLSQRTHKNTSGSLTNNSSQSTSGHTSHRSHGATKSTSRRSRTANDEEPSHRSQGTSDKTSRSSLFTAGKKSHSSQRTSGQASQTANVEESSHRSQGTSDRTSHSSQRTSGQSSQRSQSESKSSEDTNVCTMAMTHSSKGLDPAKISRPNYLPPILRSDYLHRLLNVVGAYAFNELEITKSLKDLYALRPTSFTYPKNKAAKKKLEKKLERNFEGICLQLDSILAGRQSNSIHIAVMTNQVSKDVTLGRTDEKTKAVIYGNCRTTPNFVIIHGPKLDDRNYYFLLMDPWGFSIWDYFYTVKDSEGVKIYPDKMGFQFSMRAHDYGKNWKKANEWKEFIHSYYVGYPSDLTNKLFRSLSKTPENWDDSGSAEDKKELVDEYCKQIISRSINYDQFNKYKKPEFVGEFREVFLFGETKQALLFGICHSFIHDIYIFFVKKDPTEISYLLGVKRKSKLKIIYHFVVRIGERILF